MKHVGYSIIGDTGMVKVNDIVKVCKEIGKNQNLLLDVWEPAEDPANEVVWNYYGYLQQVW